MHVLIWAVEIPNQGWSLSQWFLHILWRVLPSSTHPSVGLILQELTGDSFVAMLPKRETSALPAAESSTHRLDMKHQRARACLTSEPPGKYHVLLKSTGSSSSFTPSGFAFGLFSLHKTCDKYLVTKSCNLFFQGMFLVHLGMWLESPIQSLIIHQAPKPVGIFLSTQHTSWVLSLWVLKYHSLFSPS